MYKPQMQKKLRLKQINYINNTNIFSTQLTEGPFATTFLTSLSPRLLIDQCHSSRQFFHPRVVKDWYAQSPTLLAIGQTSCGLNESWSSHHVGQTWSNAQNNQGIKGTPTVPVCLLKRAFARALFFVFQDFGRIAWRICFLVARSCLMQHRHQRINQWDGSVGLENWKSRFVRAFATERAWCMMPYKSLHIFLQFDPYIYIYIYISIKREKERERERERKRMKRERETRRISMHIIQATNQ